MATAGMTIKNIQNNSRTTKIAPAATSLRPSTGFLRIRRSPETGTREGRSLNSLDTDVYHIRDGKVTEWWSFVEDGVGCQNVIRI
jgi:hypothetical protein